MCPTPKTQRSHGIKVALITGASSGIGAATAVHFASLGYCLALNGRNQDALKKTLEECLKENEDFNEGNILLVPGDLSSESICEEVIKKTVDHFGRLDVLVANAGIFKIGSLEKTDTKTFDQIMNVNCRAVFILMKLAAPHLIESKGNIVAVSSLAGVRGFTNILAYAMSKAALDQLVRCTALELAPKGVRVNCVNPGVVETHIFHAAGMSDRGYSKVMERAKETHPIGRAASPEEVAKCIAFLASDDQAGYLTGVSLPVDGGRQISCPN